MQDRRLEALSTRYIKRKGKLWTQTLKCGTKTQIEYILINAKWKNSALNCEAYSTLLTVRSDHNSNSKVETESEAK